MEGYHLEKRSYGIAITFCMESSCQHIKEKIRDPRWHLLSNFQDKWRTRERKTVSSLFSLFWFSIFWSQEVSGWLKKRKEEENQPVSLLELETASGETFLNLFFSLNRLLV